jgi:prophage tail gpP-like protein
VLDREKYAADANEQLDLSKIRISVSDSSGKTLSTLTDAKGGYTLYVPSGNYVLTMDDAVLGERFALAQNNIDIELKIGMEGFFYTFYVVEKKRKINMRKSGN